MSPAKKVNATKKEIIQIATRLFLERGFTDTSVKLISDSLEISTGNLTFHYPTKEDMLAILVEMLCDFQWSTMEASLNEGSSQLMPLCLELAAMAAICEENSVARDFYISAYIHPQTLDIIRVNDQKKAQRLFNSYRSNWTDGDYAEAETLVSGIEYTTLMNTASSPALPTRIAGALKAILSIYGVPAEESDQCIRDVLKLDYQNIGRQVLQEFKNFVHNITNEQLEQYLLK